MDAVRAKSIQNCEAGVRAIMDVTVELTRLGVLTPGVREALVAASAELGVYVMGDDNIEQGLDFLNGLKEEYEAKFEEALVVTQGELAAAQAEDFANQNFQQDS